MPIKLVSPWAAKLGFFSRKNWNAAPPRRTCFRTHYWWKKKRKAQHLAGNKPTTFLLHGMCSTAVLQPLCYNRCATTAGQVINSLIKRATFDKSKIRPMVSFSVSSLVGSRIRSLQSNENEAGVGFKVSAFQRNFVELKRHFFQWGNKNVKKVPR